jgi:hypothetical protein
MVISYWGEGGEGKESGGLEKGFWMDEEVVVRGY